MEHLTLKAIFWMAAVLLGCLGAPTPPAQLDILNSNIGLMRRTVDCSVTNTTFYTPSDYDIKCIPAAVQCVQAELEVVKIECKDPGKYVGGALDFWDSAKDLVTLLQVYPNNETTSSMCGCELWPQAPFHTFLDKMESLIEMINAQL